MADYDGVNWTVAQSFLTTQSVDLPARQICRRSCRSICLHVETNKRKGEFFLRFLPAVKGEL